MKEEIEEKARAIEGSQQKGTHHSRHPFRFLCLTSLHRTEERQDATGKGEEHPGTTCATNHWPTKHTPPQDDLSNTRHSASLGDTG